jgi:hypothetical protein
VASALADRTGSAASTPARPLGPADQARATRLDRAFRADWLAADAIRLTLVRLGPDRGDWTASYRYPATGEFAEGPGFSVARPDPAPTELNRCLLPSPGPVRPSICQLTARPDGSHVLTYERSGMDGRHWTYETVATHYRTNGEVVTVWMGLYGDNGSAAIPDWKFGPDFLTRVATDPRLTLR